MIPEPRSCVLQIDPYVPGRSASGAAVRQHKLSSNENPLGPSPAAREAYASAAASLERYPDGGASALREAIAATYGLNASRIICGNGSDELLGLLAHVYLREGDEALFTEHAFLIYKILTLAAGATPVIVPERDRHADVDAMLAAVSERTRIVFLANPNNPTGTYLPASEVRRLREGMRDGALLVLDAAYAEYVRRNDYDAGIELVATRQDTVMTRTFSKIHGLAAVRLGWAYAPQGVVEAVNRVRGPFNVNAPAMAAGVAAMRDLSHVDRSADHNARWLPELTRRIEALGFAVTPSVGNFVLIDFGAMEGADAREADAFLGERGIVMRAVGAYGLPQCLRMSIGDDEANEASLDALAAYAKEVRGR